MRFHYLIAAVLFLSFLFTSPFTGASQPFDLSRALLEVGEYRAVAKKIIDHVVSGPFKGQTYSRLAQFVDDVGPRLCGSPQLTFGEDYLLNMLRGDKLQNVHGEDVVLPSWNRGHEWATAILPFRNHSMSILGLGGSVGTGGKPITAPILVVESFDELTKRAAEAKGKIVVFNQKCDWKTYPTQCYGMTVPYRTQGAAKGQAVGAVAVLVRTITGFSENNPHTGVMEIGASIPAACITVEDAELFARYQARNIQVEATLYMEAQNGPSAPGRNIIAEVVGQSLPQQVVLVSGHVDSWDVGVGAMDDGIGALISWSALSIIRDLGLSPKRTVRFVGWSCEEFGGIGAQQYFDRHKSQVPNMNIVFESDMGVWAPEGMEFISPTKNANATALMQAIGQLLAPINATQVVNTGGGEDIGPWMQAGVPGGSPHTHNERYFDFHHSQADTMTVLNSDEIDLTTALWTVYAYVLADLTDMVPR